MLKAGAAVLLANLCTKLAGFVIKNVVANWFGKDIATVFVVVNDTVIGKAFAIGEQCLGPAYMPVFTKARDNEGEERAWRFTSVLFNLQALLLVVLTAVMILFPGPIIALFTQWEADDKTELRTMAEAMLPFVAPALLGMSLASLTYWILASYKKFFFAAFGDAVMRFSILGCAVLGGLLGSGDWRFIAIGAVAGGALKLLLHLVVLGRQRLRFYRATLDLRDPHLRDFVLLVLPLALGIVVSFVRDAVTTYVLTGGDNLPMYFSYGRAIVDSVGFLIPLSLSIALLPYFCDLEARNDRQQSGRLVTQTIRMLVWFFVPLSIVLAAAALPSCLVAYGGKKIGAAEGAHIAMVVQLFCLQLPFLAMEMMMMQVFFSSRRMIAPTAAGIVLSIASAGTMCLIIFGGGIKDAGHVLFIVALCLVLARILKSFVLIVLLKSSVPVLPLAETAAYAVRLVIAGGCAAAAAWGMQHLYAGPLGGVAAVVRNARVNNALQAVLIGLAGAAVYLSLSLLLKMEEPRLCWHWMREKLRRRGQKLPTPDAGPDAV